MNLKNKFAVITGSAILVGSLLAGAAFAATDGATTAATRAQVMVERLDQAVADGKLTQAAADVLKQINELRTAAMEKLQSDSQAVIDQAVKDGKVTQAEADTLLTPGGRGGFGHGGFKGGGFGFQGMTQEELKAHLDAQVAAGTLTQEQADQILSGQGRAGGKRGGFGRGGFMVQPKQSQSN